MQLVILPNLIQGKALLVKIKNVRQVPFVVIDEMNLVCVKLTAINLLQVLEPQYKAIFTYLNVQNLLIEVISLLVEIPNILKAVLIKRRHLFIIFII